MLFICLTIGLTLLSACGSSEEVTDFVNVTFSGMDSQGNANYEVSEMDMINKIFNLEGHHDYPDQKTAQAAQAVLGAYTVKIEPEEGLSNGDKVKVTVVVDENKTDKIKGGEKEFTVEGLDEPKVLTTKDVEKNLVLNFNGVSGRGVAQIDNIFDESPMNDIQFKIENDGKLKNGDKAKVVLDKDTEKYLNSSGYILDKDFQPSFEVEDLDIVAEKATDIKNLKDVERFLEEEFSEKYQNTDYTFGSNTVYKVKQEKLMYRQFDKDSSEDSYFGSSSNNNGNLIGIYAVKEYNVYDGKEELRDEFTAIYGFSGIVLDEDNKANLSELGRVNDQKGDNYSIKSVIQLYEGEGYKEVKK